jgi:hypothetical protein
MEPPGIEPHRYTASKITIPTATANDAISRIAT